MRIVVSILLRLETIAEAHASIASAIQWRDHLYSRENCQGVHIVCAYATPEFRAVDELEKAFVGASIKFKKRTFDMTQPIVPFARELFDAAESEISYRDLVLILAPGHVLIDFASLDKSVEDLESDSRNIFIVPSKELPIAALFSGAVQRARGLLAFAQDGWPIRVRRKLFGRTQYLRAGNRPLSWMQPDAKNLYDVPWLLGALASAVQEKGRRLLRLESVVWAR